MSKRKKTYINGWPVNRDRIIIKKLGDCSFQDRIINVQSKKLGLLMELVNKMLSASLPFDSYQRTFYKEELQKIIENKE